MKPYRISLALTFLAISLILSGLPPRLTAGEAGGAWTPGEMIMRSDAYVRLVRGKMPGRVERIKVQTGEIIPLDFKYKIDVEPGKTEYENAVYHGSANSALRYLSNVIKDLDRVAKPIFAAEKKAYASWEKDPKARGDWNLLPKTEDGEVMNGDGETYTKGDIFGTTIEALHLGVIVDESPSMAPFIQKVKTVVTSQFPNVVTLYTAGSFINQVDDNRWWWGQPAYAVNPFQEEFFRDPIDVGDPYQLQWDASRDAGAAVLAMAELAGFDVLYWFTDFDDPMDGLPEFCERLEASGVRIYVHPHGGRAPSLLKRVVEANGGEVITTDVSKFKVDPALMSSATIPKEDPAPGAKPVADVNVEFVFEVHEGDREAADLIQNAMLQGQQMTSTRFSESIKNADFKKIAEATAQGKTGAPITKAGSTHTFESEDRYSYIDGLLIEIDPVLTRPGTVDANLVATFAEKKNGEAPRIHRITGSTHLSHQHRHFIGRWDEEQTSRILTCITEIEGAQSTGTTPGSSDSTHFDISVYSSAAERESSRPPIARTVFPGRSGNITKSEIMTPVLFETGDGKEKQNLGLTVQISPRTDPKVEDNIEAEISLEFVSKPGGSERLPNGASVDRFEFQKIAETKILALKKPEIFPATMETLAMTDPAKSEWIAVVTAIAPMSPDASFKAEKLTLVDQPHADELKSALTKYGTALQRAFREAQSAGNSQSAEAIRREIDSYRNDDTQRDPAPSDPDLLKLRNIYAGLVATADRKRDAALIRLKKKYPHLAAREKKEKAQTEAEARAAKLAEMAKARQMAAAQPLEKKSPEPPSESERNVGKLFFTGSADGKPIELPEGLENAGVTWAHMRDRGRLLISTDDNEIIEFQHNREWRRHQHRKNVKTFLVGYGWAGSVETWDHELKWRHNPSKRSGTETGVQKVAWGGGRNGEAFLVLKLDGSLKLIPGNVTMEWDFDEWAADKKFKDIAMARHRGMQVGALAVTASGNLVAFNREGFFTLPQHLKSGVESVTSGFNAVHFATIKKNGELFEFFAPLPDPKDSIPLETYHQKWRKFPAPLLGQRPVQYIAGNWGRTIQLEDGSWLAFSRRKNGLEPLFEDILKNRKFETVTVSGSNKVEILLGIE